MSRHLLLACIVSSAALAGAAPALAQELTPGSSPGIPSYRAVNPAPDAPGPYVGTSPQAFYNTDARIAAVEQQAQSLPPSQRRRALAAIRSIRSEEREQIARHGELRDWAREHLNYRLDQLIREIPGLRG